MLSFEGIDVAVLLHALYHATTAQGMGVRHDQPDLTVQQIRIMLAANGLDKKDVFEVDWLCGRPLKIFGLNVADQEFDPTYYDRDAGGEGTAARVIAKLRADADAARQVLS